MRNYLFITFFLMLICSPLSAAPSKGFVVGTAIATLVGGSGVGAVAGLIYFDATGAPIDAMPGLIGKGAGIGAASSVVGYLAAWGLVTLCRPRPQYVAYVPFSPNSVD